MAVNYSISETFLWFFGKYLFENRSIFLSLSEWIYLMNLFSKFQLNFAVLKPMNVIVNTNWWLTDIWILLSSYRKRKDYSTLDKCTDSYLYTVKRPFLKSCPSLKPFLFKSLFDRFQTKSQRGLKIRQTKFPKTQAPKCHM